jgi:hypothetical protein
VMENRLTSQTSGKLLVQLKKLPERWLYYRVSYYPGQTVLLVYLVPAWVYVRPRGGTLLQTNLRRKGSFCIVFTTAVSKKSSNVRSSVPPTVVIRYFNTIHPILP